MPSISDNRWEWSTKYQTNSSSADDRGGAVLRHLEMTRPSPASDGTEYTRLRTKSRRQSFANTVDILSTVNEFACGLVSEANGGSANLGGCLRSLGLL